MNFPSTFTLFLLFVSVAPHQSNAQAFASAPAQAPAAATTTVTGKTMSKQELLDKACHCKYKDLCMSFLGSFPESDVKDMHGLAEFTLKMVSLNATKVYEEIEKMEAASTDDVVKQKLNDCSENYQDVIDQFEDSMPALDSKAYDDVITFITAAMNDVQSCEDGFKQPPTAKSPLTETNDVVTQLCNLCLGITNMVDK
ncbi:Pectinesterase inhibitor [Linum grandiflorum]